MHVAELHWATWAEIKSSINPFAYEIFLSRRYTTRWCTARTIIPRWNRLELNEEIALLHQSSICKSLSPQLFLSDIMAMLSFFIFSRPLKRISELKYYTSTKPTTWIFKYPRTPNLIDTTEHSFSSLTYSRDDDYVRADTHTVPVQTDRLILHLQQSMFSQRKIILSGIEPRHSCHGYTAGSVNNA